MLTFDDLVKSASGKKEDGDVEQRPGITYEFLNVEIDSGDGFPKFLKTRPKIGESMETRRGRVLEIKGIIHKYDGTVRIALGRNLGGTHAESGLGVSDDSFV